MPRREVGGGAVARRHKILAVGREGTHGARAALGRPHVASTKLLEDPRGEPLRVRLAVVSDKRVELGILEGLLVKARRESLELGEAFSTRRRVATFAACA